MDITYHTPLLKNLRTHCFSVRFNNLEVYKLDCERKGHAKGEWLRMCFMNNQPIVVPEINRNAWKMLGEINHRLNDIVSHLNAKQSCNPLTKTELFALKRQISELRSRLLTAELWSIPFNEGHAEDQAR